MLNVEHLYKNFGNNHVLRDVNLNVGKGQVVVIIGSSGTGKSTLLSCLNMLEYPDNGSIYFQNKHLTSHLKESQKNHIRSQIGMVFQNFNLFPHYSVLKNVCHAPIVVKGMEKNQAIHQAKALLDEVGLKDKIHAQPTSLSGGQQQRVAIARALAMHPRLMLFDEPTSALDPEMVKDVLKIIERLADKGMTMVVVTHEMDFARRIADKICFMYHGTILEQGTPDRIFNKPYYSQTKKFLSKEA